jgi:hypothetical protein
MTKRGSLSRLALWRRHERRARHWSLTLAYLVMASMVTACAAPWDAQPTDTPIPPLQMAHVQELSAFFVLEQQEHVGGTTFLRAIAPDSLTGAAQVVFGLGSHLYRLSVTGSTAERLYPTVPCQEFFDEVADLTHDGAWFVCANVSRAYLLRLSEDAAANSPAPLSGTVNDFLSWAPDGMTLAAPGTFADTTAGYTDHCGIGLYRLSSDRATIRQIALIWTPDFENMEGLGHNGCRLDGVSWSPDGRTLALRVDEATGQYYLLPMTPVLSAITRLNSAATPVYTVTKAMLTLLPGHYMFQISRFPIARWTLSADGLLLFNEGQTAIVRYSVVTGQTTTVFQLPDKSEHLCDLTPLPDGKRIVFTYCRTQVVEHSTPSQRLYLFTP